MGSYHERNHMSQHSKRYKSAKALVDKTKTYAIDEALTLARTTGTAKFDAGVEVHMHLGIDPKKPNELIRGTVQLPNSTGRKQRIAVFANGAAQEAAKAAGADIAGGEELIAEIKKTGKCSFDVAIATPDMMKPLAQVAKILGQKGLMPNPKNETITPDPAATIKALRGGKTTFKADETGNVHILVGKLSMDDAKLKENIVAFLDAVQRLKPQAMKGTYIRQTYLATSMGPSMKLAR